MIIAADNTNSMARTIDIPFMEDMCRTRRVLALRSYFGRTTFHIGTDHWVIQTLFQASKVQRSSQTRCRMHIIYRVEFIKIRTELVTPSTLRPPDDQSENDDVENSSNNELANCNRTSTIGVAIASVPHIHNRFPLVVIPSGCTLCSGPKPSP